MRLRLTSIDEYQFLTCLKNSLWGSKSDRFKDWQEGDYLAFIVGGVLAGLAKVSGKPFKSGEIVWDNGVFPHRVPIKFVHVLAMEQRSELREVRDVLISAWGPKFGWGILFQKALENDQAERIISSIRSHPNDLSKFESNMEQLLQEARRAREIASRKKKQKRREPIKEIPSPVEEFKTKEEESVHSRAQYTLIKLGKIMGYDVWIAPHDKNRLFKGKILGEECLKSLPNLHWPDEATHTIANIDIIWIKQNVPVFAFEVETTTSIYSGLLRMSDLLSVLPTLKIELFIVAPKGRQNRVKAELMRPTFLELGLNKFCKFIPIEELNTLFSQVKVLAGHVLPTILNKISIGFEEDIENLM